jgi:peptidoglycan LD-endopeptidase CwlK
MGRDRATSDLVQRQKARPDSSYPSFLMSLISQIKDLQRRVGVVADGIIGPVTVEATLNALPKTTPVPIKAGTSAEHGFDPRSEKNLATLRPEVQPVFRSFLARAQAIAASLGFDYVMISGLRSYAAQDKLYAQGRTAPGPQVTKARAGYSNHNFGDAADFGVFKGKAYLDSFDPSRAETVHRAVAVAARFLGLEWGGDWSRFKDFPHFEFSSGLTMAQKRAKVASGAWTA